MNVRLGSAAISMAKPCCNSLEVDLDVWPLVEELLPLLEEIERIEALAAQDDSKDKPKPQQ